MTVSFLSLAGAGFLRGDDVAKLDMLMQEVGQIKSPNPQIGKPFLSSLDALEVVTGCETQGKVTISRSASPRTLMAKPIMTPGIWSCG